MRLPKWATGFGAQVIVGMIIGLILGLLARDMDAELADDQTSWLTGVLTWTGNTYVQLLRLMIPPLVFTAVVTSVANLRKVANAAKLAVSTLVWFAITAFISVLIGIVVGVIMQPGVGAGVSTDQAAEPSRQGSWLGFVNSVVPTNFLGVGTNTNADGDVSIAFNVLQILVLSIAIGIAALKAGQAAEPFLKFSESLLKVVQVILWWIIRLAPVGSLALIGKAVATYGWEAMGSLGKFVVAIYVGCALVMFVLYPLVLAFAKIPVFGYFKRVWPVTSLGFVTRSSMGVMPVNQSVAEQSMGVPREYAAFAMPLGATSKMDGCASVYPAIAALFVAQFYGIETTVTHYVLVIIVAVLGSAATAGTTGATVMLTLTLSTLGLPLEGVGLLLATEPIIDMGRTATNVTGQNVVATVVAKRAGILDQTTWDRAEDGHFATSEVRDDSARADEHPATNSFTRADAPN
ncbi:dicarboxylate/amino acid:cation symporter [Corynebacterium cystitidis]|uniref:Na+/H+-dicarboxylate symporter n=1 Tax=Corynebacterium cystitidis DSM 20524 TaxID=1121357 RepID=A0A1H9VVB8_9CORY|nr:dicarboxylate/amino acid:cation symporter [Corynebacterium cystitidis]WJY81127.1 C4-dicarboxylate transport protein [Corynebacterium cystitidis DSM 20524]SES25615.1 Na+/H+-dicarboxylate symporter [Corynebacterium cystitidis DSM 20524]SNV89845.1 Na(+)/H(+)-dicarboxylate symporter family protein [Corynebacterium cystitidis]